MARTLNAPTEYEQRLIDRYNERLAVYTADSCFLCGKPGYWPTHAVPGPANPEAGTTSLSPVTNRAWGLCPPCARQNIPVGMKLGACKDCSKGGKVSVETDLCGRCQRRAWGRTHRCG